MESAPAGPAIRPRPTRSRPIRTIRIIVGIGFFLLFTLVEEGLAQLPGIRSRWGDQLRARGPLRLQALLQRFGGPVVKFGQLLSMRVDLLPHRYCDALAGLFDDVTPFPTSEVRRIIERELGAPVDKLFLSFEDRPIAAASIGQVHRVVLGRGKDRGSVAVVKVQRPGIVQQIESDGRALILVGTLVDRLGLLGRIEITPVFRDFLRWTRRETNFTQEAKNADRLYEETEWNQNQRIPWVFWEYTTRRVLTLEYLEGLPLSRVLERLQRGDPTLEEELTEMGCDLRTIARHLLQNFYLQAFVGEVFHGDPHPGNVVVLPDNVIGYVDFGLLGRMSPEQLREIIALVDAIAKKDVERCFVSVLDLLDAPRGLLVSDYFESFAEAADTWLDASDNPGASIQEKMMSSLIHELMDLARQIGLPLSMSNVLYFKAAISIDSMVVRLVPELDYHAETVQSLRLVRLREIEKRLSPGAALDTTLTSWLLLLRTPDFINEQLIQYQQTTHAMYRKFNQLPLVAGGMLDTLGYASVGLAVVMLIVEWREPEDLPSLLVEHHVYGVLTEFAALAPLLLLLSLLLWRWSKQLKARSLVMVQRQD